MINVELWELASKDLDGVMSHDQIVAAIMPLTNEVDENGDPIVIVAYRKRDGDKIEFRDATTGDLRAVEFWKSFPRVRRNVTLDKGPPTCRCGINAEYLAAKLKKEIAFQISQRPAKSEQADVRVDAEHEPVSPPYLGIDPNHKRFVFERDGKQAAFGNKAIPWKVAIALIEAGEGGCCYDDLNDWVWDGTATESNIEKTQSELNKILTTIGVRVRSEQSSRWWLTTA